MAQSTKGQVQAPDSQSAVKLADAAVDGKADAERLAAVAAANAVVPTVLQSHADLKLHLARSDGQTKAPQERESEAAMVERVDQLYKPFETEAPTDTIVAQAGHPDGTIHTGALEKGHELLEKLRDPKTREAYRQDGVTGEREPGAQAAQASQKQQGTGAGK
jgi:hypothetical protein